MVTDAWWMPPTPAPRVSNTEYCQFISAPVHALHLGTFNVSKRIYSLHVIMRTLLFFQCLLILPVLTACSNLSPSIRAADLAIAPFEPKMDTTLGSYGAGLEDKLILVTMDVDTHARLLAGFDSKHNIQKDTELPIPFQGLLIKLEQHYGLKRVADWPLASIGVRCLVFKNIGNQTTNALLEALSLEPEVETAQSVQLFNSTAAQPKQNNSSGGVEVAAKDTPSVNSEPLKVYDDPYLPLQHGFQELAAGISHQWATGSGVTVAVIDSGVDIEHPELNSSIETLQNFVDKNSEDFIPDSHGTAVAGIISAAANNGAGMVGIAPDAKLLAQKACWATSNDGQAICNTYTLAKALNMAIKKQVDVINLSLAGPRDPLLERLIKKALSQNIVVVGARDPINKRYFPAAVDGVMAAGLPGDTSKATVWVPGNRVISTAPENSYEFFSGSSFSTAHLSGLVALLLQLDTNLTPLQIRQVVDQSIDEVSGAVNVCLAVTHVAGADAEECDSIHTVSPST